MEPTAETAGPESETEGGSEVREQVEGRGTEITGRVPDRDLFEDGGE